MQLQNVGLGSESPYNKTCCILLSVNLQEAPFKAAEGGSNKEVLREERELH